MSKSKTITKRLLAVILTVMMLVSMVTVGMVSTSAANVEMAETGASRTFAVGDYIYIKNFTPSGWGANWFHSDVYEWAHIWDSSSSNVIDIQFELIEGTENAVGAIYGAKITKAGTYTHVIFSRSKSSTTPWDNQDQTGDIPLDATYNCYTNLSKGSTSYTGSVYEASGNTGGGGGTTVSGDIWADVDGNPETTYDKIIRSSSNTKFYLPSAKVTMYVSEGTLEIGGYTVTPEGTVVDLATGTYTFGGDYQGSVKVFRSKNVSSMHTETKIAVPQGINQGYEHKDDYETKGTIGVFAPDGTQKNSDTVLKKIKGRGNSSWEASHKIVGKYAFNITLDKKAKLIDDGSKSKKYCLVSYNADQARMRNMVAYELAEMIGSPFAPQFEPIDFYNNGKFAGSYLLTDKVEIGDPLVDIVNLDDVNEELNAVYDAEGEIIDGTNFNIYDADDVTSYRGSSSGNLNDTATKGYYKYVNLEECDASEYEDSGFLLEFELNERFDDEISGFISTKGQQIVCKYPEYASKNQIKFIRDKWNAAESVMYNKSATYEQLDAVIDVESFAKMYLIQELSKNLDGGATSFYVYYDGGKLHAGVAWDYDWAFGQYQLSQSEKIGSSDFGGNVDADPSTTGGWYLNSKKIYGDSSTLNAQAALCQNDAFWGVVVAEWDEVFYNEFSKFTNGTVSSASQLTGIIGEFYETVKYSTIMDEDKWNIIYNNPLGSWGSTSTGSTHDKAVIWLNNWLYNRAQWMDKYISTDGANHGSSPYNVDYVIQPPTVEADKAEYAKGDTVTLTITDKTGGTFTYTVYKDGTKVGTTDTDTYTFTADENGEAKYTVKATSKTSSKTSAASDAVAVAVTGCNHNWVDGVCTECGEVCAHETVEVIPGKDATCKETGLTEGKKCTVCGKVTVEQTETPVVAHTEEVVPGKDATCKETGLTEGKKCSVCGDTLVEQEEIPTIAHTEEVVPGKDATCKETGLTEGKKCSVCGDILVEQEEIPTIAHTEEVGPGKDATCKETGLTEGKKCSVCGDTL
ncbi:MAG: CotH kinase family protein, partial [Clostridia bacterium]|nr:CotH kinase family protein [Clostridia bacterium]